ncbi:CheR family methyltransferase [Sulfurimonas sp.]|jgi:chemotaxis protein methyltransferase CheR|uniref:CheR family methyltransferase n=1 Tax=Sulfurimonas sp. TaxID=2022749 RepID=UPI0025DE1A7B|nr:CheR family methyltransferase [Sulfurimonas sp.]MCK9473514.1 protein-glutamate O-methyltransferase CheR [Sulfurimonas sp.]
MFSFFKKRGNVESEHIQNIVEDYTNIIPIAEYFKSETGVTFDKQISILQNKVTTFCKQRNIYSFLELLKLIEHNRELKQALIDTLTTNETFFYREFKQIQELVGLVKDAAKEVTILCAPSATGEEPYGIAIALLEAGVAHNRFHITGIDINHDATSKAKDAIYKARNMRNLTPEIIEKYFLKDDSVYILKESVKSQVTFKVLNLFDPSFITIGKFDFIFSRNMLIYFDKETKNRAKEILESLRKNPNQEIFFGHADLF